MNKSKISFQNYGSSILLFVQGNTPRDAYQKWVSLANWGATSLLNEGEPNFVADNTISCWSTISQLVRYYFNIREHELLAKYPDGRIDGVKGAVRELAQNLAKEDFNSTTTESYRSINSDFEPYEMGTIEAEKPDDSFVELCIKQAFAS